jgi:hypothetical protein
MRTLRKPEDVFEQFTQDIETATDDQLVHLLSEKCDMTDCDIDQPTSIADPSAFGDRCGSWLDGIEECKFKLLIRLAVCGQQKAFELVHRALCGWSPSPSLVGSYIFLPSSSQVFLVNYEKYWTSDNPSKTQAFVQSGEAATNEAAAWPYDDEGCIAAYVGEYERLVAPADAVIYSLDAMSFPTMSSSAQTVEEGFQVELFAKHLYHASGLWPGETPVVNSPEAAINLPWNVIGECSAQRFGNRQKDPSLITLVF